MFAKIERFIPKTTEVNGKKVDGRHTKHTVCPTTHSEKLPNMYISLEQSDSITTEAESIFRKNFAKTKTKKKIKLGTDFGIDRRHTQWANRQMETQV